MPRNDSISYRSFRGTAGNDEHFISIQPPGELDFKEQIVFVRQHYRVALERLALPPESAVFRRVFLSDILNQASFIRDSDLLDDLVEVAPGNWTGG